MPDPRRWVPTKPRPSGEGRVLFRALDGQLIAQKWPKKRKSTAHPNSQAWAKYFGAVNKHFAFLHPKEWAGWIATAQKGRLYPRDLYTAAAMGRGFGITLDDGTVIVPRRAISDISKTLDLLGSTPATLLVRGTEEWTPVLPGQPGEVLTIAPSGNALEWRPGGSGGAGVTQRLTIPPLAPFRKTTGTGAASFAEDRLGGISAIWTPPAAFPLYHLFEFGADWTGERVTVGIDWFMPTTVTTLIGLVVTTPQRDVVFGPQVQQQANQSHFVFTLGSFFMWGTDRPFPAYQANIPTPCFFAMEREGSSLRCYIGPSPDAMLLTDTLNVTAWQDRLTDLAIRVVYASTFTRPATLRLMFTEGM